MARIIPIEEAARRLGVTVEEAEALARAGRFRVWRLWGRRYIDPREVEAAQPPGVGGTRSERGRGAAAAAVGRRTEPPA